MKYVLDASVALCWVIPRPLTPKAVRLRDEYQRTIHELLAPAIFIDEVAGALTKAERQKDIAVGQAAPLFVKVLNSPPGIDPAGVPHRQGHRYLVTDPERVLRLPLRGPRRARGV